MTKSGSLRVYALLLRLLPANFRTRFGPEMIQAFRDQLHGASFLNLVRLWIRTLADLGVTAAILHFERPAMPKHFELLIQRPRFNPYPKPFRKPLEFAWYEAQAYSSGKIQPEHILLGLLRAVQLVRQHVTPTAVEAAVALIDRHMGHERSLISAAPPELVVDEVSQQAIARAMELAALRRQRLSALHLLRALCEERGGAVPECLSCLRLDQGWLESQLKAA